MVKIHRLSTIAQELNRIGNDAIQSLTPETYNALVARLNGICVQQQQPQQPQQQQPLFNIFQPVQPAAAAAADGSGNDNAVVIEDVSSNSELTP